MRKEPNWKSLETRYGSDVACFLKRCGVKAEIIGTGFYRIPNIRILNECSKLSVTLSDRMSNSSMTKRRKIELPPEPRVSRNCYDLPEGLKRIININEKTQETAELVVASNEQSPSTAMNMKICLDELYKRRFVPEGWTFMESKKHFAPWDYEKMWERIMRTSVGRKRAIAHRLCLEDVKPLLQTFEERHKQFKYYTYLKIILSRSDNDNPLVTVKDMQTYFSKVLHGVVPPALFGKNRNVKVVKKALKQYFLSSWGETICIKNHVYSMDISSIVWLRAVSDIDTKWLIVAKVVKWLFEVFVVAILKSVFRVQKDLHSQKKNFLCSVRWKKCKAHYAKMQEEKRIIAKKSSDPSFPENNPIPPGSTRLYPKKNGVRNIYTLRFDKSPESDVAMLKSLLQQLYQRKYNSPTMKEFHYAWLKYVKKKKSNPDQKVYLVSSDIVDAYGSVSQSKLYSILRSMIDEIPGKELPLEWLAILTPNNAWKRNRIEYKYWFSFDTTFPRIQSHALVTLACDPKRPKKWVSKEHILSLLKAFILRQTVWYRGTEYILKKGLAQGSPLSPILSDIYYAHMMQDEFEIFMKSGRLARFVDDFLYVTTDEESAKKFVARIKQGIRKYHCHFNPSKTQTNVPCECAELSSFVTYLGYRIDCTSLEIAPVYADLSFRHFASMHRIYYRNEIQTFVMRMRNFSTLKLTSIVLDTRINSSAVILSTASSAAHTMALRCVALLAKIFDKFEPHVPDIWEEIRKAVTIVTKMFLRRLGGYQGEKRSAFVRTIITSIWRAFYRVFAKQPKLRRFFGDDMRTMIKNRMVS